MVRGQKKGAARKVAPRPCSDMIVGNMRSALTRFVENQAHLLARGRKFLALSRLSELPTIWSNCLAGWLLSGGGVSARLIGLCIGTMCLYLGGAFLNDACDAGWDAAKRRARPIPAGSVALPTVFLLSIAWFAAGGLILVSLGHNTAILTILLLAVIVLYDLVHKIITFSPLIMGACRCLLYLLAGSAAAEGLNGLTVWSGLALGGYTAGLHLLARKRGLSVGPCLLLLSPLLMAWIVNGRGYQWAALGFSGLLIAWLLWCAANSIWTAHQNFSLTVSGLVAGIVLVDLLAVLGGTASQGLCFLLWFGATLLLQRIVPDA